MTLRVGMDLDAGKQDGGPIALPRLLSYLSNLASLAGGPAEPPP
jgi:hypothetical protein